MSEISEDTVEAIRSGLAAESKAARRRAADALAEAARSEPAVLAMISEGLTSSDRRVRFGTAYALAASDHLSADTAPALCEALADSDGDVRWAAAELVVKLGRTQPDVIRSSLTALARDGNPEARKMALYCMRDLHSPLAEFADAASASTRDEDPHVRLAAVALLSTAFAGSELAVAQVIHTLESDRDSGVRRAAAIALGNMTINAPRRLDALRNAEGQTSDTSLARAARAALNRIARS